MDWWTYARLAATAFLDQHLLLAAGVVVFVEEAGVPLPLLPGDLVMLLLGVRAREGQVPLWQALVILELATVAGATVLYAVARRAGRRLAFRYGRYLHLTPARLVRAERWVQRHGTAAVVVARLVPGLRIVTAAACGVLAVPLRVFVPGVALGGFVYLLGFALLGYYLGAPALALVERVHLPAQLVASVLGLAAVALWLGRARRALRRALTAAAARPAAAAGDQEVPIGPGPGAGPEIGHPAPGAPKPRRDRSRAEGGATAGAVATLASTLLLNVLAHVAGLVDLDLLSPGELVHSTAVQVATVAARLGDVVLLLLAAPAFVAVGVLWGALYAARAEPHLRGLGLPDWGAGLAFAAAPLTVALLVALPALGLGFPGSDVTVAVAAGEIMRHAAYGLVLGLTYPVLRARPPRVRHRRQPRPRTA